MKMKLFQTLVGVLIILCAVMSSTINGLWVGTVTVLQIHILLLWWDR